MLVTGRFGPNLSMGGDLQERELRVAVKGGVLYCRPTSEHAAPFAYLQHAPNGNFLCITGTPIHLKQLELATALEEIVPLDSDAASERLCGFDGGFAFIHWDAQHRVLTVVTDFLGAQPLFMSRTAGELLLSSTLQGLVQRGWVKNEPDPQAWGCYLVMGHTLGERSLLRGVERVPAATVLRYQVANDSLHMQRYWPWPDPAPQITLERADLAGVFATLDRSVLGYLSYGRPGCLLLSGGFDSRVLMYLLNHHRVPAKTLIVRHPNEAGDADGLFAMAAAKREKLSYEFLAPPGAFFDSEPFREYLRRTEFANPALQLFIPRLIHALDPSAGAVWDGLGPQLMRAPKVPLQNFAAYAKPVFAKAERFLGPKAATPFSRGWQEAMYEGFHQAFRHESAQHSDDEFGIMAFIIRNRTRIRIAANPYCAWQQEMLPFTPGLTREYLGYAATLSSKCKGTHELLAEVFRRYMPNALKTPFISGGTLYNLSGRPNALHSIAHMHDWIDRRSTLTWALAKLRLRPWTADEKIPLPAAEECGRDSFLDLKGTETSALPLYAQRQLFYWRHAEQFFGSPRTAELSAQERAAAMSV